MNEREHVCAVGPNCGLGGALQKALNAFFNVLDDYTVADMVAGAVPVRKSGELAAANVAALASRTPSHA